MDNLVTALEGISFAVSLTVTVGVFLASHLGRCCQVVPALSTELVEEVLAGLQSALPACGIVVAVPYEVLLLSLRCATIVALGGVEER